MATSMRAHFCLMRAQILRCPPRTYQMHHQHLAQLKSTVSKDNIWKIQAASYAKKAGKGSKAVEPKEIMKVCTDPEYLVSRCSGSNYLREGEDPLLGADEDYPDWLWNLHIGPPLKLEEIPQDTPQYWRRLRKMHIKRTNRLLSMKKF